MDEVTLVYVLHLEAELDGVNKSIGVVMSEIQRVIMNEQISIHGHVRE